MRCIFCKLGSALSQSREHIVPESLGNTEHVLPPGIVCDACNNYLSRKVEAPFLDCHYVREQRFRLAVPSKRGRVPAVGGIHLQSLTPVELGKEPGQPDTSLRAVGEADERRLVRALARHATGTIIAPVSRPPDDYVVSRFIAKVAWEALASRLSKVPGGLDEMVDMPGLDEVRSFVRRGSPGRPWPVHRRRLYASDAQFADGGSTFEVLHEFDFLYTERNELFFVVAIFGEEFAINVGDRSLDGYGDWLDQHGRRSPLYPG